jgi:antitoxin VapB
MSISVRNPEAEKLAREAGKVFNLSMTEVIIEALKEKLERVGQKSESEALCLDKLLSISADCAVLPDMDSRTTDEILGYNSEGLLGGC